MATQPPGSTGDTGDGEDLRDRSLGELLGTQHPSGMDHLKPFGRPWTDIGWPPARPT